MRFLFIDFNLSSEERCAGCSIGPVHLTLLPKGSEWHYTYLRPGEIREWIGPVNGYVLQLGRLVIYREIEGSP